MNPGKSALAQASGGKTAPVAARTSRNHGAANGWTRRSFLEAAISWSIALFGFSALLPGYARGQERPELVGLIRSLYGAPEAADAIAQASGWDRARALAVLTRSVPPGVSGEAARDALKQGVRRDFVEDRLQLVGRRWLAETEIAIAVVLSGKPG